MRCSTSTVFVVDDDAAVRDSLTFLLAAEGIPTEVYATGMDFLASWNCHWPGCLLLDVCLPDISGIELHRRIVQQGVELPVIIMTGHGDVPMAVNAIKSGAVDFLLKPFKDHELIARVTAALDSDTRRREQEQVARQLACRFKLLTPREHQVALLVIRGQSSRQIGERLGINHKTVEAHRLNIMKKLEAGSIADLVRMALLAGIDGNSAN